MDACAGRHNGYREKRDLGAAAEYATGGLLDWLEHDARIERPDRRTGDKWADGAFSLAGNSRLLLPTGRWDALALRLPSPVVQHDKHYGRLRLPFINKKQRAGFSSWLVKIWVTSAGKVREIRSQI